MRYYEGTDPAAFKKVLEAVKGVQKVHMDSEQRVARISWDWTCRELPRLEAACAQAGMPAFIVTHAHMKIALNRMKGAGQDHEKLQKSVKDVEGVMGVDSPVGSPELRLHVDLLKLTPESLLASLKTVGFEGVIQGLFWYDAQVDGDDASKLASALIGSKGILTAAADGAHVRLWTVKAVTEEVLRKMAEKAGAKLSRIDKP